MVGGNVLGGFLCGVLRCKMICCEWPIVVTNEVI